MGPVNDCFLGATLAHSALEKSAIKIGVKKVVVAWLRAQSFTHSLSVQKSIRCDYLDILKVKTIDHYRL